MSVKMVTVDELVKMLNAEIFGSTHVENIEAKITSLGNSKPGSVSFLVSRQYKTLINSTQASVIITEASLLDGINRPDIMFLIVGNTWLAVLALLKEFSQASNLPPPTLSKAYIPESANIGKNCYIGANSTIQGNLILGNNSSIGCNSSIGHNVVIGENCMIADNVTIKNDVVVGNNVVIESGSVIGVDGFKYVNINGELTKIPQIGRVVIEDKVEIGANSTIDRAFLDETRVCWNTKIDNHVHIAHNCFIGKNCFIAAYCAFSGSVVVGDNCVFWGSVKVADNVTIGENCEILADSGIVSSIPSNSKYWGTPAIDHKEQKRIFFSLRKLPTLLRNLKKYKE